MFSDPIPDGAKCVSEDFEGISFVDLADALQVAVMEASKTTHNMRTFEILQQTGEIKDGKIALFRVVVRVYYLQ